jgi:hypothetical protein
LRARRPTSHVRRCENPRSHAELSCCLQVTSPDALVSYPHLVHQHGLLVSTLGLRFTVTSSHFVDGSMTVRCVASVSPILWQGDRESVVQRVSPLMEKNIREALLLGTPTTTSSLCLSAAHVEFPWR